MNYARTTERKNNLNMSSYSSNRSGYLHPSQYPPNPQPQPPYPTTPNPPPTSQPTAYFPSQPQQQPMYSSSPASPWQQPMYSTSPASPWQVPQGYSSSPQQQYGYSSSPTTQPTAHDAAMMMLPSNPTHHRRSSSMSQNARPQFGATAPMAIPQSGSPVYARSHGSHSSHGSHHSHHPHDHHAFGDGEDVHDDGQIYGVLDEETLRKYEKRYAKDQKLERRPTLGGSLMSMVRALGSKRD
jgi:hypothetical protein